MNLLTFKKLAQIFTIHHYSLYIVGGGVRDYLLNREIKDFDLVSDATPEAITTFLSDVDTTFARFGSITLMFEGDKVDITTLREETYQNTSRIPSAIKYVKSIEKDAKRRDFTINALYMDEKEQIYDFYHGQEDLQKGILRCIGDVKQRLNEDPLRILRGIRFKEEYNLTFESELENFIVNNIKLINLVSLTMIKKELNKFNNLSEIITKYHLDEELFIGDYPHMHADSVIIDEVNTKQELEDIKMSGCDLLISKVEDNLLKTYPLIIKEASSYDDYQKNKSSERISYLSLNHPALQNYTLIKDENQLKKVLDCALIDNTLISFNLLNKLDSVNLKKYQKRYKKFIKSL